MYGNPTAVTSVTIPSTITTIGELYDCFSSSYYYYYYYYYSYKGQDAFQQCTSLTYISFINVLTVIGQLMFSMAGDPSALTSVTIPSTITTIGES